MQEQVLDTFWHDPERPCDAHYLDLNYVPGYARMVFKERIRYLDWIIAKREVQDKAWHEEYANVHDADKCKLSRFVTGKFYQMLRELRAQRGIELEDQDPLHTTRVWCGAEFKLIYHRPPVNFYPWYLDSQRWKRKSLRKLVSVGWHCEYPHCTDRANECHHLHYANVGFEENCDLEAVCHHHHEVNHGRKF